MKNSFFLFALLTVSVAVQGQMDFKDSDFLGSLSTPEAMVNPTAGEESMETQFAISLDPLGFLQFGPMLIAEYGIVGNLVVDAHLRFPTAGMVSYLVRVEDADEIPKLSGIAFGGGLKYFFGQRRHKPYAGFLVDYEVTTDTYLEGDYDEWVQDENIVVFAVDGGYRLRFKSGFFMSPGLSLGVASSSWEWEYTNYQVNPYDKINSGTDTTPFGMIRFALGFEF